MFSFNFGRNAESCPSSNGPTPVVEDVAEEPSLEISLADFQLPFGLEEVAAVVEIEDVRLTVADSAKVVDRLRNIGSDRLSALKADKENSDLIPGVYEGGMKIWECTFDLATYLRKNLCLENCSVLDLGCGVGILGMIALKLGSNCVHFQDYNPEVLQYLTIPSVSLNGSQLSDSCRFWSGDWKSFEEADDTAFDVILTSETIYNPSNYLKLHCVLQKKLKPGGSIFIAGKSYYFGVGGSMKGFKQTVESLRVFQSETVWTSIEGVKREIIVLKHREHT